MKQINELLDLDHSLAGKYLKSYPEAWLAIPHIEEMILAIAKQLDENYVEVKDNVWIHKSANIYPSAYIEGPCIIGKNSEVRHGAFIRKNALVGDDCVVGNSVELKNVILFDHVQVPHYNYVGDSILGYYAHMGAGSVTSNVKSDKHLITVKDKDHNIETKLKKFGAIIGDYTEVGCNAVLNPGTVLARNCTVYPTSCVRGFVEENSIWKNDGKVVVKNEEILAK